MRIAALFVDSRGSYAGLPDVDLWDEKRDARKYDGPHRVVAHPPCSRWCQLAGLVQARWGHKVGDDGGCFASALASVRKWGGVLEHPAFSRAWAAYDLNPPNPGGGWTFADYVGGYTCEVEQGKYGHPARKKTWLYCNRLARLEPLRWGRATPTATVSQLRNHGGGNLPRLSKKAASSTPPAFRDALLEMVRR